MEVSAMAIDPKTGKQIRDVARSRGGRGVLTEALGKLTNNITTPSVSRITTGPSSLSRDLASARDLKQIKNRKEAEAIPEGDVRRREKF